MNAYVVVAAGLASTVEFVEALTIVLAVAQVDGWRPAWRGALGAVLVLAVLTAVFGVTIGQWVPIDWLRGIIGALLLLFGVKWWRKAIQRFSGLKPLHNEQQIYEAEMARLRQNSGNVAVAQMTAFNGVLLEGLEVVVIVLTMGSAGRAYPSAVLGAALGLLVVLSAGFLLKAPLTRVPENVMKFVVGIMLTSFGTFWAGSAVGVQWPFQDGSILVLIGGYLAVSWLVVSWLKRPRIKVMAS